MGFDVVLVVAYNTLVEDMLDLGYGLNTALLLTCWFFM